MKIAIPQLEVKEDDAFKHDQLNRKPFGEALCNLVKESSDDGLVISINAKWGEGKTTFIKILSGYNEEYTRLSVIPTICQQLSTFTINN